MHRDLKQTNVKIRKILTVDFIQDLPSSNRGLRLDLGLKSTMVPLKSLRSSLSLMNVLKTSWSLPKSKAFITSRSSSWMGTTSPNLMLKTSDSRRFIWAEIRSDKLKNNPTKSVMFFEGSILDKGCFRTEGDKVCGNGSLGAWNHKLRHEIAWHRTSLHEVQNCWFFVSMILNINVSKLSEDLPSIRTNAKEE